MLSHPLNQENWLKSFLSYIIIFISNCTDISSNSFYNISRGDNISPRRELLPMNCSDNCENVLKAQVERLVRSEGGGGGIEDKIAGRG